MKGERREKGKTGRERERERMRWFQWRERKGSSTKVGCEDRKCLEKSAERNWRKRERKWDVKTENVQKRVQAASTPRETSERETDDSRMSQVEEITTAVGRNNDSSGSQTTTDDSSGRK